MVGRDPIAGPALGSQPTLSRFENAVDRWEVIAMAHVQADTVIEHHRRRSRAAPPGSRSAPIPPTTPPRPAGVHVLQQPLRHLVLPAGGGDGDVQRRGRAVRGGGGAPAGQCPGPSGRARPLAPAALGASDRVAPADGFPVVAHVAAARPRRRRDLVAPTLYSIVGGPTALVSLAASVAGPLRRAEQP
jgi:hypothetical protein